MRIDVLAEDLGFTEGPVWLPDGRIALTSISHGRVYFVDPTGGAVRSVETGGGPNGLALGPDGELYVAQNGGIFGASVRAPAGVQMVRDGAVDYLATGMDAPNDLVAGPDGQLWVTDTRAEIDFAAPESAPPGWVWRCPLDGAEPVRVIEDGPVFVNGLGFAPGGASLLVTATLSSQLLTYDLDATGVPRPAAPGQLHLFENGWPDGFVVDASGVAWVALTAADRLDAVDANGDRVATIALPAGSLPTNVCLGGAGGDELYVTAAHQQALLRVVFDDGDYSPAPPSL